MKTLNLINHTESNLAKLKAEWVRSFGDTHTLTVKEYAELRLKGANGLRMSCGLPPYASVASFFMNAQSI